MGKYMKLAGFVALVLAVLAMFALVVPLQAATTNDQTVGSAVIPGGAKTPVVLKGTASFATTAAVSNDVYKVIALPAPFLVERVFYKIATGEGTDATLLVDIGYTDNATQYASGVASSNSTSGAVSALTSNHLVTTSGKYITVKAQGAGDAAVVDVEVQGTKFD